MLLSQVGVNVANSDKSLVLRATGSTVDFPGFLTVMSKSTLGVEDETSEGSGQEDEAPSLSTVSESERMAAALAALKVLFSFIVVNSLSDWYCLNGLINSHAILSYLDSARA